MEPEQIAALQKVITDSQKVRKILKDEGWKVVEEKILECTFLQFPN